MRNLFLILLLLFSAASFAQTPTGDRVIARQSIFIRDAWVDSVLRDTAFMGRVRSIPTADAVYKFVNGRLGNIQVKPYMDSIWKSNDSVLWKKNSINYFLGRFQPYGSYATMNGSAIVNGTWTTDPSGASNGWQGYNTTRNKQRVFENGVWKDVVPDFVTAKTIYVDNGAPNATDTRGGYSKYDFGRPFNTLQAALNAVATGDVVFVKNIQANVSVTFSTAGVTGFTLVAESRIQLNKFTFSTECTGGVNFYNIDFGYVGNTANLFETSTYQRGAMTFYNCSFVGSGGLYVHTAPGFSGAIMRMYYCNADLKTTGNVMSQTANGGFTIQLDLYNSVFSAPGGTLYGGATQLASIGTIVNSSLFIKTTCTSSIFGRAGTIANSYVKSYGGAFLKTTDPSVTNGYWSNLIIRNSKIISSATDSLRIQTGGGNAYFENSYFSNLYLRLDTGLSVGAKQTVYLTNNEIETLEFNAQQHDSLVLVSTNNRLTSGYNIATDAAFKVKAGETILPVISANRIATLPDARMKGTAVTLINRNNSGFAWQTNVPIVNLDGTTTTTLTNGKVYRLQPDGTNWNIINN